MSVTLPVAVGAAVGGVAVLVLVVVVLVRRRRHAKSPTSHYNATTINATFATVRLEAGA